jgi:hypothetical protein
VLHSSVSLEQLLKVPKSVGFREFKEEEERESLLKMSDEELIREGKAARYICSPSTNFEKPLRDVYVIALRLCQEEYRHPKP